MKTAPASPTEGGRPQPPRQWLSCLMVEDHTLIGQALIGLLRTLPGIGDVHLATTVADAIAVAADHDIDLVILDLLLPDGNGLEALRAVMRWHPDVTCIVLSSAADECACPPDVAGRVQALVDKTAAFESLRFEVEAVVRRRYSGLPAAATGIDPTRALRPREREVFELIGKGMTTKDIAATIGVTVHTVNTHRKAIVSKLGVVGAELVRLATIHNQTRPGGGHPRA
jgi:DNA-binding NarL/FixJ family response regulator